MGLKQLGPFDDLPTQAQQRRFTGTRVCSVFPTSSAPLLFVVLLPGRGVAVGGWRRRKQRCRRRTVSPRGRSSTSSTSRVRSHLTLTLSIYIVFVSSGRVAGSDFGASVPRPVLVVGVCAGEKEAKEKQTKKLQAKRSKMKVLPIPPAVQPSG